MDRLTLADAEWRHRPGLDRLAAVLGAREGTARFVGGAVRDTRLGLPVADIDIATRHAPDAVLALLRDARIKAVPTGLAHGTVTAVLEGGPVEVTTLRRDVSTDGRHAVVAFTDDWREDAARRDFTINALYADPISGQIYDYFGGLADLDARHVRFIGDPYQRIAEDHLRILRFFRFLARFGDAADPAGLEACAERANDLMALSRERIADELLKLLVAKGAVRIVGLMVERGILAPVLPEIEADGVDRLAYLAAREAEAGVPPTRSAVSPRCCPPMRRWPNRSGAASSSPMRSASGWRRRSTGPARAIRSRSPIVSGAKPPSTDCCSRGRRSGTCCRSSIGSCRASR